MKSHTAHIPDSIKNRIKDKISECKAIAEKRFDRQFMFPIIKYDVRGGVAGYANSREYSVDFNSLLLMENIDDFISRTVPHEFAHLVDAIVNPETRKSVVFGRRVKRSVHGETWKRIMRMFGAPVSRCHSYDVTNARTKQSSRKHVWKCGCGEGKVTLTNAGHTKQIKAMGTPYGYYQRGHTQNRCGAYTYMGINGSNVTPIKPPVPKTILALAASEPTTDTTTKSKKVKVSGLSKADLALTIYNLRAGDLNRQQMIALFMEELNMSKAGASTYYYKAKNTVG